MSDVVYPQDRLELQIAAMPRWGVFGGASTELALPLSLEMGLTDRFQLEVEGTAHWFQDGQAAVRRAGSVQLGGMGNFFADRELGLALSSGLEIMFPVISLHREPRVYAYEPYFIAYKALGRWHLNFQVGMEVAHRIDQGGMVEVNGQVTVAGFVTAGRFAFSLEFGVETLERAFRVAPGAMWHPMEPIELGFAVPIGTEAGVPEAGVMATVVAEHDLGGGNGRE